MNTQHLQRAKLQIEQNKNEEIIKESLSKHFQELDYQNWIQEQREQYLTIFPETRDITPDEYNQKINSKGDAEYIQYEDLEEKPDIKIPIDYSSNPNFKTFHEWINEEEIIQEALQPKYDEEGMLLQEATPPVTKKLREFTPKENYNQEVDEYLKPNRKNSLIYKLEQIDLKSIRALRSGDTKRLKELENEAKNLRENLRSLWCTYLIL